MKIKIFILSLVVFVAGLFILLPTRVNASTFGYTSVAANEIPSQGNVSCIPLSTGTNVGRVNSASVYLGHTDASYTGAEFGIYSDSSYSPHSLLASSGAFTISSGNGWKTSNISYDFSSSEVFWLCVYREGGGSVNRLFYNSSSGDFGYKDALTPPLPDVLSIDGVVTNNASFSFYLTWGLIPTPTPGPYQIGMATNSAYFIDIASNSAVALGLHNFFFEQIAFDIIVVGLILWLIIAHYVRST